MFFDHATLGVTRTSDTNNNTLRITSRQKELLKYNERIKTGEIKPATQKRYKLFLFSYQSLKMISLEPHSNILISLLLVRKCLSYKRTNSSREIYEHTAMARVLLLYFYNF